MADRPGGTGSPGARRWAQLSYTSFDPESGPGGWQVKETTGAPTEAEIDELKLRVVTNFDAAEALPQFPTADELTQLPRRLTYARSAEGTAAYWHAVQAGNDRTGRPGNVFSHVVLDRDPDAGLPALRPIDLWRSPDLLVPFGPDRVLAAALGPAEVPSPGPQAGVAATLAFVNDPATWRLGVLCVLLDAVAAALAGGPRVVLLTESADSAAQWIGAVSQLTTAAVSRRLSWSVYERATNLTTAWARGIHLAAVPLADAEKIQASDDVVVVRESETPALGELGGAHHRTAAGSTVQVTAWSEMAQVVLVADDVAHTTLSRMADLDARLGPAPVDVSWPLAMAVVLGGDEVEDALAYAQVVLQEASPAEAWGDGVLGPVLSATIADRAGTTPAEAWACLSALPETVSARSRAVILEKYLSLAVVDRDWQRQQVTSIPEFRLQEGPGMRALRELARSVLQQELETQGSTIDDAAYHVRLVDFLDQVHLLDEANGSHGPTRDVAVQLLAGVALPMIEDPVRGIHLVRAIGPVSRSFREGVLRQVIDAGWFSTFEGTYLPGVAYPTEVVGWLCGGLVTDSLTQASLRADRRCAPFDLEIALWLAGQRVKHDGLAGVIVCGLLSALGSWERVVSERFSFVWTGPWALGVGDLLAVERAFPGQVPAEFFSPALVSATFDADLAELRTALARRPRSEVTDLAELRNMCHLARADPSWSSIGNEPWVVSVVHLLSRANPAAIAGENIAWEDIAPLFLECALVETTRAPHAFGFVPEQVRLVVAAGRAASAGEAGERLRRRVDMTVERTALVRAIAYLAWISSPAAPLDVTGPPVQALGEVVVEHGGVLQRLLEIPLAHAIAVGWVDDPEVITRAISAQYRKHVPPDYGENGIKSDALDKRVSEWWRQLGVADDRHGGARIRLRPGSRKER